MGIMNWTMWSMVIGMSFISIGGLLLWVYGDSLRIRDRQSGHDSRAVRAKYSGVIVYSAVLILSGIGFMVYGTFSLLATINVQGA